MSRAVAAIVGTGTAVLRQPMQDAAPLALIDEACRCAIVDAGIGTDEIDGIGIAGTQSWTGSAGPLMPSAINRASVRYHVPFEGGLLTAAVEESILALQRGEAHSILLVRLAYENPVAKATPSTGVAGASQFTLPYGHGAVSQWYALGYQRYLHQSGRVADDMARLVVTQRDHANLNEDARFYGSVLTMDDYLGAAWVSNPLRLYDCDASIKGCIAFVLTTADRARGLPAAYIAGYARSSQPARRDARLHYALRNHVELGRGLAATLWSNSGLTPTAVNVAELYDGFSPIVCYWLEALGFCEPGEALKFTTEGETSLAGSLPVNTAGGHLSEGRLYGAGHLAEAVRQVRGLAGQRQVAGCEVAVSTEGLPGHRGGAVVLTASP